MQEMRAGRWLLLLLLACSLDACRTFFAAPGAPAALARVPPAAAGHPLHQRLPACVAPAAPARRMRAAWGATGLRQTAAASSESESADEDDGVGDAEAEAFFQAPGLTIRDISSMTVPQLKDELRERGLKVGGNKGELLERLSAALEGRIAAPGAVTTSRSRPAAASARKVGASAPTKPAGGGIMLAEGERLPQAPPIPKRSIETTPTARIFARGLPFRVSPRDVAFTFEEAFGPVAKLEGMTLDGRATGHAFVTFENAEIARDAVEEGRIEMDNRPVYFSPPWSLAARNALREMADFAAWQAELRGDGPPQGSERAPLARSGRDVSTDYVPVAAATEEEDGDEEEPGGRTLFVGRVPLDAEEDDIRDALSAMGEVERIFMGRVSKNNPDSDFAGYAHVVMKDLAGVTTAINSPVSIKGQRVRLDRAVDGAKETREERFPLEQQYHGSLIGVAGRTVAELERQSGARVTFETTPFPCMVAKGSALQRRSAWQAAQQALAALGTESSNIPRHMWAVIIGAGGANIRRIESQSGARLQLEEEPEPHLKIQGMPEARKTAKALVRAILEREEEEFFDVPAKYHGLLVGKRGMTVKEIQRDSGAIISFIKKPQPGMVVKGLPPQRDTAWGITQQVITQLPLVLAEMRGVDAETAAAQLDETFGYPSARASQSSASQSLDEDEEVANPREDPLWEEAVARAVERAKALFKEEQAAQRRRERGGV